MQKFKLPLIIVLIVVALAGGVFLFQETSSGPGCDGDWPCMLYFYTDW